MALRDQIGLARSNMALRDRMWPCEILWDHSYMTSDVYVIHNISLFSKIKCSLNYLAS